MKYRESKDASRHAEELDPENNLKSLKTHTSCNPLDAPLDPCSLKVMPKPLDHIYLSNPSIIHDEENKRNDIEKPEHYSGMNGNEAPNDGHKEIESKLKDNTGNPL